MSKSGEISHKGKVLTITPDTTIVEIVSESACASCHAKSMCSLGDVKAKIVEVPTSPWNKFEPGDEVDVVFKASMGHRAVFLAYVIPLIVMVLVLLGGSLFSLSELNSALAALVAVAFYYFCLYLLRGRIKREYIFNLEKHT